MVAENEEIPSLQVADISDIDLQNALFEVGYVASLRNIKCSLFMIFEKYGKLQFLLYFYSIFYSVLQLSVLIPLI